MNIKDVKIIIRALLEDEPRYASRKVMELEIPIDKKIELIGEIMGTSDYPEAVDMLLDEFVSNHLLNCNKPIIATDWNIPELDTNTHIISEKCACSNPDFGVSEGVFTSRRLQQKTVEG